MCNNTQVIFLIAVIYVSIVQSTQSLEVDSEFQCAEDLEKCKILCNKVDNDWTFEDYIDCHPEFKEVLDNNITSEKQDINQLWYFNYMPSFVDYTA